MQSSFVRLLLTVTLLLGVCACGLRVQELRLEIEILRKMRHDNIITMFDVYETMTELFIVQEICVGGELFVRPHRHRHQLHTSAAGGALRERARTGRCWTHFCSSLRGTANCASLSAPFRRPQDRIKAQPAGSYSEKDAQQVLRQICTGLAYLHSHKIAHCDLKPVS